MASGFEFVHRAEYDLKHDYRKTSNRCAIPLYYTTTSFTYASLICQTQL